MKMKWLIDYIKSHKKIFIGTGSVIALAAVGIVLIAVFNSYPKTPGIFKTAEMTLPGNAVDTSGANITTENTSGTMPVTDTAPGVTIAVTTEPQQTTSNSLTLSPTPKTAGVTSNGTTAATTSASSASNTSAAATAATTAATTAVTASPTPAPPTEVEMESSIWSRVESSRSGLTTTRDPAMTDRAQQYSDPNNHSGSQTSAVTDTWKTIVLQKDGKWSTNLSTTQRFSSRSECISSFVNALMTNPDHSPTLATNAERTNFGVGVGHRVNEQGLDCYDVWICCTAPS